MKRLALWFLFPALLLATRASPEPSPCTHRTVHVTGTIRDRDGSILPSARVTYSALKWNEDCSEGIWEDYGTESSALGLYSITGPEQGKLLVLHPSRQSYPPELALREDMRTGDVWADYQLHMFRVQGHVVDLEGRDAEGITVQYCRGGAMDCLVLGPGFTTPRFELFLPRGEPYSFIVTKPDTKVFQGFGITLFSDTTITYSLKPE